MLTHWSYGFLALTHRCMGGWSWSMKWVAETCQGTRTLAPAMAAIRPWWRHQMEIFSELLAFCAGNSPITGEFPSQRPVTQSFDVFFHLRLNKRLIKQSRRRWFETPSGSCRRHCNALRILHAHLMVVALDFEIERWLEWFLNGHALDGIEGCHGWKSAVPSSGLGVMASQITCNSNVCSIAHLE